ncbi:MFS transporter [Microtetraspora sp. NBRC 16547]|uniref:MFS transporter n=1 Tax=Microtetraspora sp. NBRC 16547 TaxID=3030993 RepID=UPI0024A07824|nr:MFS transporter [Microtetraspora sp. NBRC 16547]GLW99371.1 MFS transporter [Microtetraspora sp. NBRC 16547]
MRWRVACGGVLVQLALGSGYAWSVVGSALQQDEAFGLSTAQAVLPFQLLIGMVFIGSVAGARLRRLGPRVPILIGGVLFAIGVVLASLVTTPGYWWGIALGYGLIGGVGLGIAYFALISLLQEWFFDKRMIITAVTGLGFGLGALCTAVCGQWLLRQNPEVPTVALLPLGIAYLALVLVGSVLLSAPPASKAMVGANAAGSMPEGPRATDQRSGYTPAEALRTPQWHLLTVILALNTCIGLALISRTAASAQEIAGFSVSRAALLVGVLSLVNGCGPVAWTRIATRVGQVPALTFLNCLSGSCVLFIPHASNELLFFAVAAIAYWCYGGVFGVVSATVSEYFGMEYAGVIYARMLSGWSVGGLVGPWIVVSAAGPGHPTLAYTVLGCLGIVAAFLTLVTRAPGLRPERV